MTCNLNFNPISSDLPFQISLITDTISTILKIVDPINFDADSNFLSFETTTANGITTHTVVYLNETDESKIFRLRNITDIPGVWSDSVIINIQTAGENTVPFSVDIIPPHTVFTMDLRWQLENIDGDFYGPYIGTLDNIKNVPEGDYTLRVLDLAGNIFNEQQISTDDESIEVFIDVEYGTLTVNFNVPVETQVSDFSYYLISDFGDTSLSDYYNNITYDLESGLYYFAVLYNNELLLKEDPNIDMGVYIYDNINSMITITINDNLKIESVS